MAVLKCATSRCRSLAAGDHVRRHVQRCGIPTPVQTPTPSADPAINITRRRNTSVACKCDAEFEPGIIRGASVKYNDSRALRLRRRALLQWQPGSPSKVLIIKKPKNLAASAKLREIGTWLKARGIQVFVERVVWATEFKEFEVFDPHVNRDSIDFCITLGGDGTVLYMTSLFEEDEPLPPTLCFAMGSLGFLTPFDASACVPTLERVLDTSVTPLFCTLRTRKRCEVVHGGQLEAVHHVLNECVVDRGAFPGAVLLEIFADGAYITNVEADGLIISTPSGSTAYSMSAGGPIVAPSVPCTVLTPLAPLSLSFRPLVIPESSSLCVHLPTCARAHARASFDGRRPMRIRRGTSIFFTASLCPLPIISLGRMDTDWYEGITSKLKWNQAIRQLPSCPSPAATAHLTGQMGPGLLGAADVAAPAAAEACRLLESPATQRPVPIAPAPVRPVAAAAAASGARSAAAAAAEEEAEAQAAAEARAVVAAARAAVAAEEAAREFFNGGSDTFDSCEDCGSGSDIPCDIFLGDCPLSGIPPTPPAPPPGAAAAAALAEATALPSAPAPGARGGTAAEATAVVTPRAAAHGPSAAAPPPAIGKGGGGYGGEGTGSSNGGAASDTEGTQAAGAGRSRLVQ